MGRNQRVHHNVRYRDRFMFPTRRVGLFSFLGRFPSRVLNVSGIHNNFTGSRAQPTPSLPTGSSHQDSLSPHNDMTHDITDEFRNFVDQKRKGLGDSRRTKTGRQSHPTPGDTQMDGAPPFMQAYMKEAYTIVSQLFCLFVTPASYA